VSQWKIIRQEVLERAGWRCQACGVRRRLDVHHVVKRSQGGSDFDLDLLVALCRWCHDQTDAPYLRGRLVATALGDGQFHFDVIRRNSEREFPSQGGR
jgi:5-methylcytosine-specific restriction endonuclease McrA